jgi:hypothetical protein
MIMLFLFLCAVFIVYATCDLHKILNSKEGEKTNINHGIGLCGVLLLGIGFWIF